MCQQNAYDVGMLETLYLVRSEVNLHSDLAGWVTTRHMTCPVKLLQARYTYVSGLVLIIFKPVKVIAFTCW